MVKSIKLYWFLILLTIIAVFLFFLKLTQKPKTQPPPSAPTTTPIVSLPPFPFKPLSLFGQRVSGNLLKTSLDKRSFENIPTLLPIFPKPKNFVESSTAKMKTIAKDLNFSSPPKTVTKNQRKELYWQKGENFLSAFPETGQFIFQGEITLAKTEISSSEVKNLIKNRLLSWGIVKQEDQTEIEGFAISGQQMERIADLSKAQIYRIIFFQNLDQYPVISLEVTGHTVEARIGRNGKLLYLKAHFLQPEGQSQTARLIKSFGEVVRELERGGGELWRVTTPDEKISSPPPEEQIKQITVENVSFAYYLDQKPQLEYQPIFLLEGKITFSNESTATSLLILPALR